MPCCKPESVIILFEGVLAEIRLTLRTVNGLKPFCAAQHGHQVCDALPCASPLRMPPLHSPPRTCYCTDKALRALSHCFLFFFFFVVVGLCGCTMQYISIHALVFMDHLHKPRARALLSSSGKRNACQQLGHKVLQVSSISIQVFPQSIRNLELNSVRERGGTATLLFDVNTVIRIPVWVIF